jgi:hypothetical protein
MLLACCSENRTTSTEARHRNRYRGAITVEVVGLQQPIATTIAIPMPIPTLFMHLGARIAHEILFRK